MNIFEENTSGQFGEFGGKFIPETLSFAIEELEHEYSKISQSESFQKSFQNLLKEFVGRPTPLYFAKNLTEHYGGPKIYFKREDLAHLGAHKINNAVGQGWNFPIDNIEVNLILPGTANIIQQTAYTGLDGSRNNNYTFNKKEYVQGVTLTLDVGGAQMELQTTQQNSNVIQYKNVRPFSTHEGLTIAVSWPKGIERINNSYQGTAEMIKTVS